MPGTNGLVLAGPTANTVVPTYPTSVGCSPISIGPGLVMASDNTLGSFSPYQGRIYAAFVGTTTSRRRFKNPTDNTDIFLTYSDDGGRSWSNPVQVNDDNAQTDGYTEATDANLSRTTMVTGRVQFQPEVAVDPTTGTLVISWRDGRDDAARARVATYITTSIDGGQTFSAQTYANPSHTAIDAITGQTVFSGRRPTTSRGAITTGHRLWLWHPDGAGRLQRSGLPDLGRKLEPGHIVNGAVQGPLLCTSFTSRWSSPAGPRIIDSDHGTDPAMQRRPVARSASTSPSTGRSIRPA